MRQAPPSPPQSRSRPSVPLTSSLDMSGKRFVLFKRFAFHARSESWLSIAQLALASGTLTSTCLPDAVAVDQRRNLTNIAGESFPVGVAVFTWASAGLTSAMIEILTEEVLGYNTRS